MSHCCLPRIACVAIALYAGYTYFCDRDRYNELSVPINNALRDACGGGGVGGGYYPGGWNGHYTGGGSSGPSEYNFVHQLFVVFPALHASLSPCTPVTHTSVTETVSINCLCLSTMRCAVPAAAGAEEAGTGPVVVAVAAGVAAAAGEVAAAAQVSTTLPGTPLHLQLLALI